MQFTERYVKSLKPKDKAYDLREKSGKGFGITIFPSGEKSFIYIYHFGGRKRRMTLGKYPHCSLADARRLHREALAVLESSKDPAVEKQKRKIAVRDSSTIGGLIDEYIEKWAKPNKRSWRADERCLNKDIRPVWGKRKVSEITRRDIILLLDNIKDRGAPIQANRVLACVSKMFNFAIERDITPNNPCAGVKPVAKENRRDRVLTDEEIRILWQGLDQTTTSDSTQHIICMSEQVKLALKLQLVTAQRKGEVISAEWTEFDLISGWWVIPANKSKNNLAHRVPLSRLAISLLKEIKDLSNNSHFLFPSKFKDTHIKATSVDHAVRRSSFDGVKPWTPHDLRRTVASHITSIGIPRLVVSKILNHSETSVTAIYDRHGYDNEKRNALEAWAKRLQEIIHESVQDKTNIYSLKSIRVGS
ncbi:site-specific integrase [Legionella israelensis]|uniref:Site-specific integrase n=1 Tax=Legionella israelensis TaxID=454 RepID=A0AAX1EFG6_9GAMM|nr:site-specific integrase [Legionella israelensis]QBR83839.1 site-specific integrase [Legionella israelensis]